MENLVLLFPYIKNPNHENLMFTKSSIPIYLLIALLIALSVIFKANNNSPATPPPNSISYNVFSNIKPVEIPQTVVFAGEEVPVEKFDVRERLDRELLVNTYWHSNTLQLFKLSTRYFPDIEKILEKNGVPDDFKYLALAESGLRNVTSYANAVGYWQFLEGSAKELGLEINNEVDERYHIERSTEAACKYLKDAYNEFGSWALAAASYNMGKSRLKKVLREQQVDSYYDLYLNDETSRYVFRIIALREICENPKNYGFNLNPGDLYEPILTREIQVHSDIKDIPSFAIEWGTNYKTLKLLNPWLRQPSLSVKKGKSYTIKLPYENGKDC